jgi:hypothetical protein
VSVLSVGQAVMNQTKKAVKKAIIRSLLKNPYVLVAISLFILLFAMIGITVMTFMSSILEEEQIEEGQDIGIGTYQIEGGTAKVSPAVMKWEPLVRQYAEKYGVESYVPLLLALIQQESSGLHLDVMQSSESLGLPPGAITDPEMSIDAGVRHFKAVLDEAKGDVKLCLQSYNFGSGFISYALARGGYSKEVAIEFSQMMAVKNGWSRYGDVDYVDHVLRYYQGGTNTVTVLTASGDQSFDVNQVHDIMKQFLGLPYVWGGRKPSAGGFDCSGLLEYAFAQIGKDLYGTAATQFDKTVSVKESDIQPGDLIFFSTYKPGPSHVGMYVGNGQFINANGSGGVSYSSVEQWKKLYPFLGFRRVQ